MAKDDLDGLALDDDERALIARMRKERKEKSDREVWIKSSDGNEARMPFEAAQKWLRKHGFDLDDSEPEPEPEPDEDEDEAKDKPVRFAGRRVG